MLTKFSALNQQSCTTVTPEVEEMTCSSCLSQSLGSYTDLMGWLRDFEVHQDRALQALWEQINEIWTDVAALVHTGTSEYEQMDSSSSTQLSSLSTESLIQRGVMAGWSQT